MSPSTRDPVFDPCQTTLYHYYSEECNIICYSIFYFKPVTFLCNSLTQNQKYIKWVNVEMLSLSWACQLGSCPSAHLRRSEHFQSIRRRSEAHCPGLPTCLRCCWRPSSHRLPAQPSLAGWPPSPQRLENAPSRKREGWRGKGCLPLPSPTSKELSKKPQPWLLDASLWASTFNL